jgi:hypothetical protein
MFTVFRSVSKPQRNAVTATYRALPRHLSTSPQRLTEKLIYPEAPSKDHKNLTTFLAYVERSRLDKRSTVYKGTLYEYTIAETLSQYGFYLKRVGGASDRGMDLLGTWTIPSTTDTMKVIVQCKAGAKSPGPSNVRELKGALKAAPPGWRGADVLGLLVSEKPATKGVQDELHTDMPLAYICCSREGTVAQVLWNHRAQEIGLEGMSVGVRHSDDDPNAKQIILMKDGKTLPLLEGAVSQAEAVETLEESTG